MGSAIEERIVKMTFDNASFEKNASTSMKTLDKLKEKLNFSGAVKGLENVANAAGGLTLTGLEYSVGTVTKGFSALEEIAIGALRRIGEQAVAAGERLVKSVTVEQVAAGWEKYAEKTSAVQTIMAATSDQFNNQGQQMEFVNGQLEKLNWFTDETSFSLTDMTGNIGKFTSAGVDLETATKAMEGIATATSLAGQNAQAASRVMYNFSQSLGAGAVKLQDWMSVENANVATKEFKETIIETAKELGALGKNSTVTYKNFRESLKEGWFTGEVLTGALVKYGNFADELNELYEAVDEDYTTSELIQFLDEYKKGSKDLTKISKETGVSVEELTKRFESLTSEGNALGMKAFKAAQEAKTFGEAIDATKDAVSTSWMNIFETLFGNYLEAKDVWTGLANWMYDAFAEPVNELGRKLKSVFEIPHARDTFLNIFSELARIVEEFIQPLKDAFAELFPEKTAGQIYGSIYKIQYALSKVTLEGEKAEKLKSIFSGILSIFKIIGNVISGVASALKFEFGDGVKKAGSGIIDISAKIGDWIKNLSETTLSAEKVRETVVNAIDWIKDKIDILKEKIELIKPYIDAVIDKVKEFAAVLKEKWELDGAEKIHRIFESLHSLFQKIAEKAAPVKDALKGIFDGLSRILTIDNVVKVFESLANAMDFLFSALEKVGSIIGNVFKTIFDALGSGNASALTTLANGGIFGALLITLKDFISNSKELFSGVSDVLGSLKGVLEGYQKDLKADALIKIAVAIGILAASLVILSRIDTSSLLPAIGAMGFLFAELTAALKSLGGSSSGIKGLIDTASIKNLASALQTVAIAIGVLSVAMKILSTISWGGIAKGLASITILLGELIVVSKAMDGTKMVSASAGLILLSTSMVIMASAVKSFGELGLGELIKGLFGFSVVLTTLVAATKILDGQKLSSGSVGLVLMASAMKIFASAVKDFGVMDIPTLAKGLISFGLALAAVTAAMVFMPSGADMVGTGVGLLAVGAAMLLVAKAVENLGSNDLQTLGAGLLAMTIALGEVVLAMNLATGAIGGAAAILIVSAAMLALTVPLSILGKMKLSEIGKGLLALGGALAIILAAALGAEFVAPGLLALSVALLAIGAASVGIGAGLTLIGVGLSSIALGFNLLASLGSVAATAVVASISTIVKGVIQMIPDIAVGLATGLVMLLDTLSKNVPILVNLVVTLVGQLLPALEQFIPKVIEFVLKVITGVLAAIDEHVGEIVEHVLSILVNILEGIANKIPELIQSGMDIVTALMQGISNSTLDFINTGMQLIIDFINGLADSIRTNTPLMIEAINNLMDAVIDAIIAYFTNFVDKGIEIVEKIAGAFLDNISKPVEAIKELVSKVVTAIEDRVSDFKEAAGNLIQGLIDGITDGIGRVVDAARELGSKILNSLKGSLEEESPSKATHLMGVFLDKGLEEGLDDGKRSLVRSAGLLGKDTVSALEDSLSNLNSIIDGNLELNPMIRPGLDLSEVNNGIGIIDSLFQNARYLKFSQLQAEDSAYGQDIIVNNAIYLDGKLITNTVNKELGARI